MTNIAGQTRDETQSIHCPKCAAMMEKVAFGGITVDRCLNCKGLWFDAREQERLRDMPGSEQIDTGQIGATAASARPTTSLHCPVCHTPMILMTDHRQPHLKYESCTVCYGAFFDAGEFRDYKEHTLVESLRHMFRGRPK